MDGLLRDLGSSSLLLFMSMSFGLVTAFIAGAIRHSLVAMVAGVAITLSTCLVLIFYAPASSNAIADFVEAVREGGHPDLAASALKGAGVEPGQPILASDLRNARSSYESRLASQKANEIGRLMESGELPDKQESAADDAVGETDLADLMGRD